jgi:transposase
MCDWYHAAGSGSDHGSTSKWILFVLCTLQSSFTIMAPLLSDEMRQCIIVWHHEEHLSASDIHTLAGCSLRTVYNILQFHRDYGTVDNPFARPHGGVRTLDMGDVNYLASIIDAHPKIYLDELQQELLLHQNIEVSISTISRALQQLAISRKKVLHEAIERNELLRATWQAEYGDIPAEYFVWLDEAGVDDQTNQRKDGWAAVGRACISRATFIRGQRFSVLPALTHKGIIALDIFEGSVNKEKFIQFIDQQLVCCFSSLFAVATYFTFRHHS